MKDIPSIRAGALLARLISQGEHEQQDFKYQISDARKIARSISAFANRSGGRLLVGVKDNGVIAGVRNEEDIYVIEQAAEMYCRPAQQVEFAALRSAEGTTVIRASVPRAQSRPVLAQEPDRSWRAYYRVADENIAAHPLMVNGWQLAASLSPESMRLDGPDVAILDSLRLFGEMEVDQVLLNSRASRRVAQAAVARLAALGLVEFRHARDCWHLAPAPDAPSY